MKPIEHKEPLHVWSGNLTGLVMSTLKKCPIKRPQERFKYLGFTNNIGWPKTLNTGRELHQPSGISVVRMRKRKKLVGAYKTDTK